jgi:hypothetical protein
MNQKQAQTLQTNISSSTDHYAIFHTNLTLQILGRISNPKRNCSLPHVDQPAQIKVP